MHDWFSSELQDLHERRGSKRWVQAPRGSAKSTYGSLFYPMMVALERLENLVWLIADTAPQAQAYLDSIWEEVKDNEQLAAEGFGGLLAVGGGSASVRRAAVAVSRRREVHGVRTASPGVLRPSARRGGAGRGSAGNNANGPRCWTMSITPSANSRRSVACRWLSPRRAKAGTLSVFFLPRKG